MWPFDKFVTQKQLGNIRWCYNSSLTYYDINWDQILLRLHPNLNKEEVESVKKRSLEEEEGSSNPYGSLWKYQSFVFKESYSHIDGNREKIVFHRKGKESKQQPPERFPEYHVDGEFIPSYRGTLKTPWNPNDREIKLELFSNRLRVKSLDGLDSPELGQTEDEPMIFAFPTEHLLGLAIAIAIKDLIDYPYIIKFPDHILNYLSQYGWIQDKSLEPDIRIGEEGTKYEEFYSLYEGSEKHKKYYQQEILPKLNSLYKVFEGLQIGIGRYHTHENFHINWKFNSKYASAMFVMDFFKPQNVDYLPPSDYRRKKYLR